MIKIAFRLKSEKLLSFSFSYWSQIFMKNSLYSTLTIIYYLHKYVFQFPLTVISIFVKFIKN